MTPNLHGPVEDQRGVMFEHAYRWVYGLPGAMRSPYWRVIARGEPFDRGPRRNVLLEQLLPVPAGPSEGMTDGQLGPLHVIDGLAYRATGLRVVRPFRGLRRVRP